MNGNDFINFTGCLCITEILWQELIPLLEDGNTGSLT
jgi:hypothetical protein